MCVAFTTARTEALLRGDLSGTIIHPVLVSIADLIGFVHWQDATAKYSMACEEKLLSAVQTAMMILLAEDALFGFEKPTVIIQAHGLLAYYWHWRLRFRHGETSLLMAIRLAKQFDFTKIVEAHLNTIPENARAPGSLSCDALQDHEELLSIICQSVHIDSCLQIIQGAEPRIAERRVHSLYMLQVSR